MQCPVFDMTSQHAPVQYETDKGYQIAMAGNPVAVLRGLQVDVTELR